MAGKPGVGISAMDRCSCFVGVWARVTYLWLLPGLLVIFVVLLTDRILIQLLETKGNSVSMIPELPGGLNQAKLVV